MSSRKRSTRRLGNRNLRRSIHPMMEDLEQRLVLSSQPVPAALQDFPDYIIREVAVPGQAGKYMPLQAPTPTLSGGYTPQQIEGAYGINQVSFGAIKGDGSGQTIAVIDAGDNTGLEPTGPNFAGSALQKFDQTFGIPDPPSFQKFNQNGGTALPPPNAGFGTEIALDIEWAHAMAPGANIVLVEASDAGFNNLLQAANTAVTKLGASVVSMSFGSILEYFGEGGLEPILDSLYLAPALAFNPNVTFLASTGDHGSPIPGAPAGGPAPAIPRSRP